MNSVLFDFRGKRNQCELIILEDFIEELVGICICPWKNGYNFNIHSIPETSYWLYLDDKKEGVKDDFKIPCKDNLENGMTLLEKYVMKTGLMKSRIWFWIFEVWCPIGR